MPDGRDTAEGGHRTIHREGRQKGATRQVVPIMTTLGFRPRCRCKDALYAERYPRTGNARKAHQQDAQDAWWPRVRLLPLDPKRAGTVPGVAADPFMGSGTTAMVAVEEGRGAVGAELSEAYAKQTLMRAHGVLNYRQVKLFEDVP